MWTGQVCFNSGIKLLAVICRWAFTLCRNPLFPHQSKEGRGVPSTSLIRSASRVVTSIKDQSRRRFHHIAADQR